METKRAKTECRLCGIKDTANFHDVKVLYDAVCFDHRPLCASFICPVLCNPVHVNNDVRQSKLPNWYKATTDTTVCYRDILNNYLTNKYIPKELLSYNGACSMCEHHNLLDVYCNKIIGCISCATENVIPLHSIHNSIIFLAGLNMLL